MDKVKLLVLITLTFCACAGAAMAQTKKPNIIIFISDDQSQIDVGCYGNQDVHTPHMDKLASEGMRFTSAYAASPMCAPSRSNMFTGLYPFRNGSQMNHFALRPGTKTLPDYLKALGYHVAIAGKIDVYPQPDFEHIGAYFGKYLPAENRNDPQKATVHFIKDYFDRPSGQPLCLIVSTWLPHVPWGKSQDFDPEKLTLPDYLVDTKATRQALAAYYQSISKADTMLGEVMDAVDQSAEKDNTVFMFFSDQGTQFPGAKWTTYDQGLRIPFIVRWPDQVKAGSVTNALISLTDLTPTLIDLAGGKPVEELDGKSFADVFLGKKKDHREYVFAETSMEPQYWYNYVPARTLITKDGLHYIRNYYPGVRFITHIDKVEQNMFYFDSWVEKAKHDEQANFLLNRYSYRPAEELYDLQKDPWELNNLAEDQEYAKQHTRLKNLLAQELAKQGEKEEIILQGDLPTFYDRSYQIKQGISVSDLSFNKNRWNPDTLFITAYLEGIAQDGVICDYFDQFSIITSDKKMGVRFDEDHVFYSKSLTEDKGHMIFKLTSSGDLQVDYNGNQIISANMDGDHTKIQSGYISCGLVRGKALPANQPNVFKGKIHDLRVSMGTLVREPRK